MIFISNLISHPNTYIDLQQNVVIVGSGAILKVIAEEITKSKTSIYNLVGFIDENKPLGENIYEDYNNISRINNLSNILDKNNIDEIIIVDNNLQIEELIKIMSKLNKFKIKLSLLSDKFDIIKKTYQVDIIKYSSLYSIQAQFNNFNKYLKRLIDLVFSTLLVVFLCPLLLTISALIKLTSKGPVIFSQKRIGLEGKAFTFYKFRTMKMGSDMDPKREKDMITFIKGNEGNNNQLHNKIINIKNVTRIGSILRKYSLDELPQLFNVFKGNMSLIGPRPLLEYEYEHLEDWHKQRNAMRPGCSGLWQIFGRSKTNFDEMIIMDMFYIDNSNLFLDIKLIIKTIPVMMTGSGGG